MSDGETPTQQVTNERTAPQVVTDSKGRRLTLRKIGALQKLRLFKACGAQASVPQYLGLAMLASAVSAIDDVPVIQPVNEQQIEALVDKLGDEAFEAIGPALAPPDDAEEDTLAAAKN